MVAVFLVGFMGSGKSSVGAELARRLGWEFIDLDKRIESHANKTIAEIFRDAGEASFRQLETMELCELLKSQSRSSVIALGGGAFVQPQNRDLLRRHRTVFLDAPVEELWRRGSGEPTARPLRQNQEQFALLYGQRLPYYKEATITVNTGGQDVTSVCTEIEQALKLTAREG